MRRLRELRPYSSPAGSSSDHTVGSRFGQPQRKNGPRSHEGVTSLPAPCEPKHHSPGDFTASAARIDIPSAS